MSNPYAAFRSRGFRFFLAGNFLSVTGRQMLSVTVGWEIYRRTGSPLALGLIGLAGALPIITLAIPAGHMADRFSRRGIILVNQLVTVCTSSALALVSLHRAPVGWIYALLVVAGIARTFGWAARNPFMVNLVPKDDFNNAVTWNSSAFGVSSVAGPAVAGMLLVHHPYWIVYALDAACALAFFLFMLATPRDRDTGRAEKRPEGLTGLFDGLRFVWSTKVVLATITLDLFAVLFGGATALLPIFADTILHVGAAGLGWLRAAPSVGSIVMAMILAHSPPMKRPGLALLFAVTGFGIVTIVFGLSRSFPLSLAMLGLSGAFDNISVVVRHTLVQLLTPDAMRGRVSAVNNVFIGSSNELGGFESGLTARLFGTRTSVIAGGIGTVVVVMFVSLIWPQLRRYGSLTSQTAEVDTKPAFEVVPLSKPS